MSPQTIMEPTDDSSIKELEKKVRALTKKLERSETDRQALERLNDRRQAVLKSVIRELEQSKTVLENRSHTLESALRDLQALQVKLIESEKMSALGVMVAGIAHEINNPVGFIHGNLDHAEAYLQSLFELVGLYQRQYPDPGEIVQKKLKEIDLDFVQSDSKELFQSMKVGSERIKEIVLSLRNFSRLDEAELKSVNLHEGIDNTLMILQHRLKANDKRPAIEVVKQYGDLPLVECYAGKVNQVFMNLLANAIDALEESNQTRSFQEIETCPNTIWIRTDHLACKNQVRIAIADNGSGISEAARSNLFDPFFTTKPVGKGTGLGLSISYQVVTENHGGRLWCESKPGEETQFVIELPVFGSCPPAAKQNQ